MGQGTALLHSRRVIHRDIKPANFLLTPKATVKLCDFGLSKEQTAGVLMTQQAITLHYRAPEVLLGSQLYTTATDMWALGVVLAELFVDSPLFPGEDEQHQIALIYALLGTPPPGSPLCQLPYFLAYEATAPFSLEAYLEIQDKDILSLISNLLCLDAGKRRSASQVLALPLL